MARLHVLGAGASMPVPARQTSTLLLETRRSLIFFGCGSGLMRLRDPLYRLILERHSRALILLADFGLDHAGGLPWLPELLAGVEVCVARPMAPADGRDPLETMLSAPFSPTDPDTWTRGFPLGMHVVTPRPGRNRILGESVQAIPAPSGGWWFRVRDLVFAREGGLAATGRPLLEGARALVHASGSFEGEGGPALWKQAAEEAKVAGMESLVLCDLPPAAETEDLDRLLMAACDVFPRTNLAGDLQALDFTGKADTEDAAAPGETPPEGAGGAEGAPLEAAETTGSEGPPTPEDATVGPEEEATGTTEAAEAPRPEEG